MGTDYIILMLLSGLAAMFWLGYSWGRISMECIVIRMIDEEYDGIADVDTAGTAGPIPTYTTTCGTSGPCEILTVPDNTESTS